MSSVAVAVGARTYAELRWLPPPQSWRTKKLIVELEGADCLIPHLMSRDWVTQMYAAAAIQNMCQNVEFASSLASRGALKPLRSLLKSTQPIVVRFAAGALKNIGDAYEEIQQKAGGEEDGEDEEDEGDTRGKRPFAMLRSKTGLAKKGKTDKRPKVLRQGDVETAINARVQQEQERREREEWAAITVQKRWRGIFAREDAEVIRHFHRAGAAITNALRRSPKMQEIMRRREALEARADKLTAAEIHKIVLVQANWRRFMAMRLAAEIREADGAENANDRSAPVA